MILKEFNDLWEFIVKRSNEAAMPVVQDKDELEYVFNLLKDCESYLEVGTAEGNSLYVLANAMKEGSRITYIDWAESHTKENRDFILSKLHNYKITPIHADSNDWSAQNKAMTVSPYYDAVLIDAGHEDFNVVIDAFLYGRMAKKYLIFHDIQIPDVNRVFEWYSKQRPELRKMRIVNSEHYGFGILCMQ